jgi:hypothetical protein
MHFPRLSHDGGPVALVLPQPLPVEAEATIRVEGDFMSHDPSRRSADACPAGAERLEVAGPRTFPPTFRHFDVTLAVPGFAASRVFGHRDLACAQGPPPPRSRARSRKRSGRGRAGGEADTVRAIARLALGDGGPETRAMIEASLPRIDDCWDCADFALVPLIWCRTRWPDLLGPEPLRPHRPDDRGLPLLDGRAGDDVQWYFSENHALLFHTAAHLGGHLLPDATFAARAAGAPSSPPRGPSACALARPLRGLGDGQFNSAPLLPPSTSGP